MTATHVKLVEHGAGRSPSGRIRFAQALRGVAYLMVVWSHPERPSIRLGRIVDEKLSRRGAPPDLAAQPVAGGS